MTREVEPPTQHASRDRPVGWLLAIIVVGAFVFALNDQWDAVRTTIGGLTPAVLATSLALAVLGLLGPWRAWVAVVGELGSDVPAGPSARIFFVSQLAKYVPGAVWPVLLQLRQARALGIPRSRVAVSFIVTLAFGVATGLLVGLLALPALVETPTWAYVVAAIAAAAGVVALHPAAVTWLVRRLLLVARRPDPGLVLTGRGVVRIVTGTCLFWLVGGLSLWVVVVDLGGDPLGSLPVAVGALALAVSIGPLFVFLPAGAGVREAILVAALSGTLTVPEAVSAALVSRAVLVVGDGLLAAVSLRWRPGSPDE